MPERNDAAAAEQRAAQHDRADTARLMAFSDGVFAIAITLLVLEIHRPEVERGLWDALLDQWPSYASYLLSFVVIGIIWAQHHHLYRHIAHTDHLFLLINVAFLMWVSFIPFPTGLLADYLRNDHEARTAMAFYAGTFVVGAVIFNLFWFYASHDDRLIDDVADRRAMQVTTRSYGLGPLLYLLDFGLAFISVTASFVLFALIAVLYAVGPLFAERNA